MTRPQLPAADSSFPPIWSCLQAAAKEGADSALLHQSESTRQTCDELPHVPSWKCWNGRDGSTQACNSIAPVAAVVAACELVTNEEPSVQERTAEQEEILFVRPEVILTEMKTPAADVSEGDAIESIDDDCNHETAGPQRQSGSLAKMRILIRLRLDSKEITASPVQIHAVRAVLHQGRVLSRSGVLGKTT